MRVLVLVVVDGQLLQHSEHALEPQQQAYGFRAVGVLRRGEMGEGRWEGRLEDKAMREGRRGFCPGGCGGGQAECAGCSVGARDAGGADGAADAERDALAAAAPLADAACEPC